MPSLIGLTPEQLEYRRKCFEGNDQTIINAFGVMAFPTAGDFILYQYTADNDYFITESSLCVYRFAGSMLIGWSKANPLVPIGVFLFGSGANWNTSNPSVFSGMTVSGTNQSTSKVFKYDPYGIYVYKGQTIYLIARGNVNAGWDYQCNLKMVQVIY